MALVSIFRPTSHLPSQPCSPWFVAFWMAHLALSVALATMVLAMSSMTVAMATGRRWGVGLGSSETKHKLKTQGTYYVQISRKSDPKLNGLCPKINPKLKSLIGW